MPTGASSSKAGVKQGPRVFYGKQVKKPTTTTTTIAAKKTPKPAKMEHREEIGDESIPPGHVYDAELTSELHRILRVSQWGVQEEEEEIADKNEAMADYSGTVHLEQPDRDGGAGSKGWNLGL